MTDVEDLCLILEDASSYESGGVANLVAVTDMLELYILEMVRPMISKFPLSARSWFDLNDLVKHKVIPVKTLLDIRGSREILGAVDSAPSIAMFSKGAKFHEEVKELMRGGGSGIEDDAKKELREKVEKTLKEIYGGIC